MVIVRLIGGLGNQLFQFAAAKSIAIQNNTTLLIDSRDLDNPNQIRKFSLDHFTLEYQNATDQELDRFLNRNQNLFSKVLIKLFKLYPTYKETYFQFNSSVFKMGSNLYLDGYFQSEKYFKSIESEIRNDFQFKNTPNFQNQTMLKQISNVNSISIHVRRADYVTNSNTNQVHGTCSLEYYQTAISFVKSKITNPHFFVFSDDIEWSKQNLTLDDNTEFIDFNIGKLDHEDLRLMSACKHNIIANSSFSWWGAWLNQNSQKIVIAPKKWFNDTTINTIDLIPENWIQL